MKKYHSDRINLKNSNLNRSDSKSKFMLIKAIKKSV